MPDDNRTEIKSEIIHFKEMNQHLKTDFKSLFPIVSYLFLNIWTMNHVS